MVCLCVGEVEKCCHVKSWENWWQRGTLRCAVWDGEGGRCVVAHLECRLSFGKEGWDPHADICGETSVREDADCLGWVNIIKEPRYIEKKEGPSVTCCSGALNVVDIQYVSCSNPCMAWSNLAEHGILNLTRPCGGTASDNYAPILARTSRKNVTNLQL